MKNANEKKTLILFVLKIYSEIIGKEITHFHIFLNDFNFTVFVFILGIKFCIMIMISDNIRNFIIKCFTTHLAWI